MSPSTPAPPGGAQADRAPTGTWTLTPDPDSGDQVARWQPATPGDAAASSTERQVVRARSSWTLEPHLGFVLPDAVHAALATGPTRPVALDAAARPPGHGRPRPADLLRLPGGQVTTYRRALAASRPLHTWHLPASPDTTGRPYLLEIVNAVPVDDGRRALIYRLRAGNQVLAGGDDIEIPADVDLRDDATARSLVAMLVHPDVSDGGSGTPAVLVRHEHALLAAVAERPAPYPPGVRVAVATPHAGRVTGTVVGLIHSPGRTVSSYRWRPDTAACAGHPWSHPHAARNSVISPVSAVRPTLLSREDALRPRNDPDRPLAAGTVVSHLADDETQRTGTVLRAVPAEDAPAYDIQFQPDTPPAHLDGRDLEVLLPALSRPRPTQPAAGTGNVDGTAAPDEGTQRPRAGRPDAQPRPGGGRRRPPRRPTTDATNPADPTGRPGQPVGPAGVDLAELVDLAGRLSTDGRRS